MGAGPHPHVDPVRRWRGKAQAQAQGCFQQRRDLAEEDLAEDSIEHQWLSFTKSIAKEHAPFSAFSVFRSYVIQIEYNILAYLSIFVFIKSPK